MKKRPESGQWDSKLTSIEVGQLVRILFSVWAVDPDTGVQRTQTRLMFLGVHIKLCRQTRNRHRNSTKIDANSNKQWFHTWSFSTFSSLSLDLVCRRLISCIFGTYFHLFFSTYFHIFKPLWALKTDDESRSSERKYHRQEKKSCQHFFTLLKAHAGRSISFGWLKEERKKVAVSFFKGETVIFHYFLLLSLIFPRGSPAFYGRK